MPLTITENKPARSGAARDQARVLVAGIGGASLGTEVIKSLLASGRFTVFGCDLSAEAYGHFVEGLRESFVVPIDGYVEAVIDLCRRHGIAAIVPGGEGPLRLLSDASALLDAAGIHLAANEEHVVRRCAEKHALFEHLGALGFAVPRCTTITRHAEIADFEDVGYPCIVKPSGRSGGSQDVFIARRRDEAAVYAQHIVSTGTPALLQQYIPHDEGEYSIGVLSLPDGQIVGSIALRRHFHARLSVHCRSDAGLISSGYSQGWIDRFPVLCAQAERLARALESAGPLNVQGRVVGGTLLPFEINPRFSASTYLRALAGFNEIEIYLRHVLFGEKPRLPSIRPGWYLRSLSEVAVHSSPTQPRPNRRGRARPVTIHA